MSLPSGKKICPGWTPEYGPAKGKPQQCGGSSLGRRRSDAAIVDNGVANCSRCHRQKFKYDEEMGARQMRAARDRVEQEGLIAAYVNDVKVSVAAVDSTAAIPIIAFLLGALDGLIARNERPPYAQYGEPGWVLPYWKPRALSDSTKLDILRALAGVSLRED